MSSRSLLAILAGLLLTPAVQAQREPSSAYLGKKIANLSFQDDAGKTHSLYDLKNKKAIVLVFYSFECPVSTSYAQPLAELCKEMENHGVAFMGLTINDDDTPAQVAKQAKHYNLNFPVYIDKKLVAAKALKAEITPECFVLDGDYVLRYRGRIDNSYSERLKKHPQTTRRDLQQVLGEMLSGRPVSESATLAVGCYIPREEKVASKTGNVTYHRDVQPILQNHCQQCHRPGEVGPFSLMTYKQAVNWADDIKGYTKSGIMPPWKAVGGPAFHDDRRLSAKEIDTLAAWADGGTPEGDPKDAPPARQFPDGWQLGKPDLILSADADFTVGPTGNDVFRCFVIPTHVTEDKYIAAVEVRPSNPRVVHHALLFIDTTGTGRKLEKAAQEKKGGADKDHAATSIFDQGPGYSMAMGTGVPRQGGLSGWAPGQMPRFLPDNSGYFLPKNADVVMQVHYHRNGRIEKDRTQVGLYFAKPNVNRPWRASEIAGKAGILGILFSIPPGAERFHVQGDKWAEKDFTLHTIMPHMHMVGKEVKVTMTPPDGQPTTLIAIKEWDYNWQETYMFKEPIHVKKDTHFHVDAYYDNSTKNPNNPFNPPQLIRYGEQTTNEMCYIFLGGTTGEPGRGGLPMTYKPPAKTLNKTAIDEPKKGSKAATPFKLIRPVEDEKPAKETKAVPVPFKLTDTQHVMVRVKINGKGPFNFIVDTGAPIMFVATPVAKKIGLESNPKGLTVLDKVEFEGGLTQEKVKCRVETPFQLEGMNGMGLPGVELHGILGYTVLAKYRMEVDFSKPAMLWTPLDWKPPPPEALGGRDGAQAGLEILGSMMKFLGPLMGLKPAGPPVGRGFVGMVLGEKDGLVSVEKILEKSPAAEGGLKAGDRVEEINGQGVKTLADVQRLTAKVLAGQLIRFAIQRGAEKIDLKITAGEGL
jgi:peroxiredoxin